MSRAHWVSDIHKLCVPSQAFSLSQISKHLESDRKLPNFKTISLIVCFILDLYGTPGSRKKPSLWYGQGISFLIHSLGGIFLKPSSYFRSFPPQIGSLPKRIIAKSLKGLK